MADPSAFPTEHLSEPVVYRRISGFAIAGIILAVCYAVGLGFALFLSLRYKTPPIYPIWTLAVPVLATVLSVMALWLISRSGSTLTGGVLAQIACWISVVVGLGYASYFVATRFAIVNQANAYTMKWFKDMEDGKIGLAFMGTRDPKYRAGINPEDESRINTMFANALQSSPESGSKGCLDLFRDNDIVRIVGQGGTGKDLVPPYPIQITPMGVVEWEWKSGNYSVQRTYFIETMEGKFLTVINTIGMQSQTGEYAGREWLVNLPEIKVQTVDRTPLGRTLLEKVPPASASFVAGWLEKLVLHEGEEAYLDTVDRTERSRLRDQLLARIVPGSLGACLAAQDPSATLMAAVALTVDYELADRTLPGYAAFRKAQFLTADNVETDFTMTKPVVAGALQALFDGRIPIPEAGTPPKFQLLSLSPRSGRRYWKLTPDKRLQIPHDIVLGYHADAHDSEPERDYDMHLILTVELPEDTTPESWRILNAELVSARRRKPPTPK